MSELIPLLNVADVRRSIAFYRTALGAAVESEWAHEGRVRWARIAFPSGKLMLNAPDAAEAGDGAARRERAEFADTVFYWMCDDAPALRAKLLAAGLAPGELHREEYGNVEFALRDPDGYALRFSSPANAEP